MQWIRNAFGDLGAGAGDMIRHEHFKLRAGDGRLQTCFSGKIYEGILPPLDSDPGVLPRLVVCAFLGQLRNVVGAREIEVRVQDVVQFAHPSFDISTSTAEAMPGPERLMQWLRERRDEPAVRLLPVQVGQVSVNLLAHAPRYEPVPPLSPEPGIYHLVLETICTTYVDLETGRPKDLVLAGG